MGAVKKIKDAKVVGPGRGQGGTMSEGVSEYGVQEEVALMLTPTGGAEPTSQRGQLRRERTRQIRGTWVAGTGREWLEKKTDGGAL